MRRPIVVANWKMNKGLVESQKFIEELKYSPDAEIITIYNQTKDLFAKVYEFSFDNKLETAKEIAKIYDALKKKTNEYEPEKKQDVHILIFLKTIINSIITIQEMQLPYMNI